MKNPDPGAQLKPLVYRISTPHDSTVKAHGARGDALLRARVVALTLLRGLELIGDEPVGPAVRTALLLHNLS